MTAPMGVIGLGAMGSGMAQSLRRAGFAVHVFDLRPGVAATMAPGSVFVICSSVDPQH